MSATDYLAASLPLDSRVNVTVTRVNRMGTARWMTVHTLDGEDLTPAVAALLGARLDKAGAMYVRGTGMDMRFHVLEGLSWRLFGQVGRLHRA